MGEVELIAAAAFGMEAIVVRELRDLGYTDITVEDGRVRFRGDLSAICRANLWLRCAERVQLVVADFPARDFDDLFDRVKELPWEEWLADDARFPVTARCVRSTIRSVPNTQKMVKRAIVERLRKIYSRHWFAETGIEYCIDASIVGDRALLTIDTTGDGLHKRGYRNLVGQAPLRETVAAAMIKLSYWSRDRLLVDPFCGSGTIPIEAALIGRNLAPGRNRSFASENWPQVSSALWAAARQEIKDVENRQPLPIPIVATDRDRYAIKMAKQHARQAGVETDIHFEVKDFVAFPTNRDAGILICNPPYGERLGDEQEVLQLYADMGELLRPLDDWSLYILTSAEGFERAFGKPADRRRKLYNARIACTYYQYLGPKPAGAEPVEDIPTSMAPARPVREHQPRAAVVPPAPRAEVAPPAADNPWTRLRPPQEKRTVGPNTAAGPASAPPPQPVPEEPSPPPAERAPSSAGPWKKAGSSLTEKAGSPAEWRRQTAEQTGGEQSPSSAIPPEPASPTGAQSTSDEPSQDAATKTDATEPSAPVVPEDRSIVPSPLPKSDESSTAGTPPPAPAHPWTKHPWPR